MIKKIIAFSFIVWAIVAFSSACPSQASYVLLPMEGVTEVRATPATKAGDTVCGSPYIVFGILQLMIIPGVGGMWVPVEFQYPTGLLKMELVAPCENGGFIYQASDF